MVTRHREAMLLYVGTTILGSVGGCLMMHAIGKKGGEALVRKRFAGARIEKTMASLQRHGVMVIDFQFRVMRVFAEDEGMNIGRGGVGVGFRF